ncbi:hypothetical protein H6P81_002749 [Aristolochia fimbriata]|uniref:Uncharacterized protein n=1 Tax=Aristolochia fimbriata TaxID=158543 RepID=A0AAV7FBS5_ARIFI|nr:hypothetical protein H6P81_002749 [Aristolochia fimbriata]
MARASISPPSCRLNDLLRWYCSGGSHGVERLMDECHKPLWQPSSIQDRVEPSVELSITPSKDVELVSRISQKGRVGEDWEAFHRDYITRWQARQDTIIRGRWACTPRHAPKPATVYHARGYTEEALLGYVWNVIEEVQHGEGMDSSLSVPHMREIGSYCQSILHSLLLLEGSITAGDLSRRGELLT